MPLLSYAHGVSHEPLVGMTIGANLEATVARAPDVEALVDVPAGRRFTYGELDEAVDRLASGLHAFGISKSDRVGIWSPSCAEWVLLQYATAKLGTILVNINPAYKSHELEYVLQQSGIQLLVSAVSFKESDYAAMLDEVRARSSKLPDIVYLGSEHWLELARTPIDADALTQCQAALSADDPINIQYTSGTTGFPKGATLSHHNILNNGYFIGRLLGYSENDRICVPVPLYHCFGMVIGNLAATSNGSTIVIPAPAFEPAATLRAVQDEGCTSLYGVPTMFIAELALPSFREFDLSSLRTGVMAGSPCPVEVMKRVVSEMHMTEVAICYGMTETSPVSTMTRREDPVERRVSTVGTAIPHVEVKVVAPESGLTVERGATGELCTRGYSVMLGYWDEPAKTDEAIDAAGWMHTGDLAVMDAEGYLNIVGRIKDMVIRGGENVYPREIEEFLYRHPAVADVQVVGVPDERYGEELCAWVRLREGAAASEDELRDFCRASLAHFKTPRYVVFVDAFPMTVTGKIQKYKIREESIERFGLAKAAAVEHA